MSTTSIEWTDRVWNPVTGCTKVSQGCKHCYAEGIANRFFAKQYPPNTDGSPRQFTDVRCHPDRLDDPMHWRKPARIFVNSMSDLFHEAVPDEFIVRVFMEMASCARHTFQILTKRPARALSLLSRVKPCDPALKLGWSTLDGAVPEVYGGIANRLFNHDNWPLPNVWLGISVEDQKTADERIPLLLETPAAVRWVSYEPALGPVNLLWRWVSKGHPYGGGPMVNLNRPWEEPKELPGLDWVVCGGESGPDARPCNVEWLRSIVQQCKAANVPAFVKQFGGKPYDPAWHGDGTEQGSAMLLNDRKGGDPAEWPDDLRVREFPEVRLGS